MTKVFVHGNPETSAIWDELIAELSRRGVTDTVCLSPPGFGAPTPREWGATAAEYRAWLEDQLLAIGGRIDLVGHDWGAGHVFGVLAADPGSVTSWAADCAGLLHADYVWHDAALSWQTPGVGEAAAAGLVGLDRDTFIGAFTSLGMTADIAGAVSDGLDDETARCIVALYRSAAQPAMAELGRRFVAARPANGLVVVAEEDHYAGTTAMMEEVAASVGAHVARVPACGHWWMIQNPVLAADLLIGHWDSVG